MSSDLSTIPSLFESKTRNATAKKEKGKNSDVIEMRFLSSGGKEELTSKARLVISETCEKFHHAFHVR
jgi:hypothetical protein